MIITFNCEQCGEEVTYEKKNKSGQKRYLCDACKRKNHKEYLKLENYVGKPVISANRATHAAPGEHVKQHLPAINKREFDRAYRKFCKNRGLNACKPVVQKSHAEALRKESDARAQRMIDLYSKK